ncbi:MAG: hypothetical protein Q7R92_04510 [bacterium]|nr:hypothetical protein [bacterium]
MFSETNLGSFLRKVYSGHYSQLLRKESALALATLLLADESITQDKLTRDELRSVLAAIYGDDVIWRSHEGQLCGAIYSELLQILTEIKANKHFKAVAYITGLLGKTDEYFTFEKCRLCQRIYSKTLRIFHNLVPKLSFRGQNLFIGIIGLKGSGKSSVLHIFKKEGEEVLELYRELGCLGDNYADKLIILPPKENWEDEPLKLILQLRGLTAQTQRKIFIGSLLRWSEVELLSQYGKVIFIHLKSANMLRHIRAKNRGRQIEKTADKARLIELDAHRDGLWPTYERNDLGGLVCICSHTILNNQSATTNNLCEQIKNIIEKEI